MAVVQINHVDVPQVLAQVLGCIDPGTRMYRRFGRREEFPAWFDAVCEACRPEGGVSPGALGLYANVSRVGVHKRMKEGGLTAFLFHLTNGGETAHDEEGPAKISIRPYTIIPLTECRQWAALIHARRRGERPKAEPARQASEAGETREGTWRQW